MRVQQLVLLILGSSNLLFLPQEEAPARLSELFKTVDAAKQRLILQRMALQLTPIMEKAIVDPPLTHRFLLLPFCLI